MADCFLGPVGPGGPQGLPLRADVEGRHRQHPGRCHNLLPDGPSGVGPNSREPRGQGGPVGDIGERQREGEDQQGMLRNDEGLSLVTAIGAHLRTNQTVFWLIWSLTFPHGNGV